MIRITRQDYLTHKLIQKQANIYGKQIATFENTEILTKPYTVRCHKLTPLNASAKAGFEVPPHH